jgi:hypothetical protein
MAKCTGSIRVLTDKLVVAHDTLFFSPLAVQNVLEFENGLKDKLIPFGLKEKEKLLKLKEEEKKSLNLPFDGEINAWDFR